MIDPRDLTPARRPPTEPPAAGPADPDDQETREVDLDWRTLVMAMVAFVMLAAVTGLVRAAPRAITVLAVGSMLALALDPVVSRVERRFDCERGPAVWVVIAGLLAAALLIVALLAPRAIEQGRELGGDVDRIVTQINDLPVVGDDLEKAGTAETARRWIEDLPARLQGNDTPIGGALLRLADGLLVAGFTALITLALLLDGPRLVRGLCGLVPVRRRERAVRIGRLAYSTVGRYFAGSLLVACVAGIATLVVGLVLRVPLAPLAAVWVAVWDLVPQIGGAAGGIPFVLLGLTRGAGTAVGCAAFFILYLQIENHVIQPLVVGRAVRLSPPATMTAALVGVSAGGLVGALLAVPVVAAAKVVYLELRSPGQTPTDAAAA